MSNIFGLTHEIYKSKLCHEPSPVFLNVSKKILARESIFRNIDCNMACQQKRSSYAYINEQQIKTSLIYQKMLQRIQKAKQKHNCQVAQLKNKIHHLSQQILSQKQQIQQGKVDMWQLRNQIIQLEEMLNEELQEYDQLEQEIDNEEDIDAEYYEQDLENGQDGYQQNQAGQQSTQDINRIFYNQDSESSLQQEQQEQSKPSCSIRDLMSKRSICTPGLVIEQYSEAELKSQNSSFTQIYVRGQEQLN